MATSNRLQEQHPLCSSEPLYPWTGASYLGRQSEPRSFWRVLWFAPGTWKRNVVVGLGYLLGVLLLLSVVRYAVGLF